MKEEDNFFTVKEFAKELRLSVGTVQKLIRDKKIIALQPGGGRNSRYRIPRIEIERLALKKMNEE